MKNKIDFEEIEKTRRFRNIEILHNRIGEFKTVSEYCHVNYLNGFTANRISRDLMLDRRTVKSILHDTGLLESYDKKKSIREKPWTTADEIEFIKKASVKYCETVLTRSVWGDMDGESIIEAAQQRINGGF